MLCLIACIFISTADHPRRQPPKELSINGLAPLARHGICQKLDIEDDFGGDYRELAARFEMSSNCLDLISQGANRTHRVLRWAGRNPENTVAKLREILLDMGRFDCIQIIGSYSM